MKDHTLTVTIARPAQEVFEFTLDPANTPKWIDFIAEEQASERLSKLGTIYRNRSAGGPWSEYELTSYDQNRHFTLSRQNSSYHVAYTLKPIGDNLTELEYHEWVDEGELEAAFDQKYLEKLKQVMEPAS